MIDPNEIPEWCVQSIGAVSAWMKERGYESWTIAGIGPVPENIVLHGQGTQPNWLFIATRQEQTFHNKLPVYATIDPIQPAAKTGSDG